MTHPQSNGPFSPIDAKTGAALQFTNMLLPTQERAVWVSVRIKRSGVKESIEKWSAQAMNGVRVGRFEHDAQTVGFTAA